MGSSWSTGRDDDQQLGSESESEETSTSVTVGSGVYCLGYQLTHPSRRTAYMGRMNLILNVIQIVERSTKARRNLRRQSHTTLTHPLLECQVTLALVLTPNVSRSEVRRNLRRRIPKTCPTRFMAETRMRTKKQLLQVRNLIFFCGISKSTDDKVGIWAADVTVGLRRLPAGFYTAVQHSGHEWRTENKAVSADDDNVEWREPIPL